MTFDPHSDSQQRCPRCGRFMSMREERYEAGDADVWHECTNPECQRIITEAENAYWASFDIDAFRAALDEPQPSVQCPGCDCDPVGYAPHNGKGDCPPIHENRSTT